MALMEFGPWRPDRPALGNPCTVARNVLRGEVGYRQFRSFVNTIAALAERVQGACAVKEVGGGAHIYAGTASTLQHLQPGGAAFVDRSKAGGYGCSDDELWGSALYSTSLFFGNINDPIQVATVGAATAFADLSADAPRARRLAVWGDHLVAANLFTDDLGYVPSAVHWSKFRDPGTWPALGSDAAAQARSDRRILPNSGAIAAITSGEFGGMVIGEKNISVATVVSDSRIFDIQPVEQSRGTRFPGGVAGVGRLVFWPGDDGFWMFDGVQSIPIGAEKVDRWFLADLDPIYVPRICSAIDPQNKLYMVAYPGAGHSGGTPNRILIFCWSPKVMEWTYLDLTGSTLEFLFSALSLGQTLDSLDDLGYNIDTLPFSLDSFVWEGGVPLLGAFDGSHRMGAFSGSAMAARLTTGDVQHIPGRRALTTSVTPLVSSAPGAVTVTPLTKSRLADTATAGAASTMNAAGECPLMASGRYQGYQLDVAGGFGDALGVDPTFEDDGAY
jgi:hypothetical protein